MKGWAHMDMVAAELGMLYYGGACAFYDQPGPEQSEALAVALARNAAPELGQGPLTYRATVKVWNDAHTKKKPVNRDLGDALLGRMEGGV